MTACLGRRENKVERDLGKGTVVEKQERENAFHSTKTFENLGTAANGTEIFRKRTIQPKILEIPEAKWNGKKTCEKNFSKI